MDAYSIGIAIALTDRVTGPMAMVTKSMMTAGQHTDHLKKQLKDCHDTMMKMAVLQNVGANMFHGGAEALSEMLEHAKEYSSEITKMNIVGMKGVEIEKAKSAAVKNSARDATTTYTDNLKHIQDLRSAMGFEHAVEMLPAFTDAIRISRASGDPKQAEKAEQQTIFGAKALEVSGAMAQGREHAEEQLDLMRRVGSMTHGRVDFKEYLNFFKQAKSAGMMYDDEYKYKVSQYFMQEMGGLRWGTENQAMNQTLNQGVMTVAAAQNMQKQGLIWDKHEITKKNVRNVASTSVTGGDLWKSNPFEAVMKWQDKILEHNPQIKAIKDDNKRFKAEADIVNHLGLKTNTTDAIVKMLMNQNMLKQKEFPMFDATKTRKQALSDTQKSAVDAEAKMKAQFNNAATTLGNAELPFAIKAMNTLADGLKKVNEFMTAHPMVPKIIAATIAAVTLLGGIVAVGASAALLVSVLTITGASVGAVAGWIATAVAASTIALLAFSGDLPKIWKKAVDMVTNWLKPLPGVVQSCLATIGIFIVAFFGNLGQQLAGAMGPLGGALSAVTHAMMDGAVKKLASADSHMSVAQGAKTAIDNANVAQGQKNGQKGASAITPALTTQSHLPTKSPMSPNFKSGNSTSHNSSHSIGPVAINIHQQPGENGEDLAKRTISQLIDAFHGGLVGSSAGGGTLESAFHFGGAVG